jgi:HAE1 family hydrophobic/amphiphilic exporter-1
MLGLVGGQFMPKSDEEQTSIAYETPVGSSLDYTKSKGLEIQRFLGTRSEVKYSYLSIGGSSQNNEVNRGSIFVKMTPAHERRLSQEQFEADIRKVLPRFVGANARILQLGTVGGSSAPIVIHLNGPELGKLQDLSDRAIASLKDVPGLVELKSSLDGRKPEWLVDVNRDLASQVGLSVGQIGQSLRPALSGVKAGDWEDESGLAHDIVVRAAPEARTSRDDLLRMPIATSNVNARTGNPVMVPLAQVATLRRGGAPAQIDRQRLERVATIEGNYQGRPLTDVTRDIESRLRTLQLPAGYRFDFGGEQQDFAETVGYMVEALGLAVILLYIILASQFGDLLQPLAIMLSLPLSLIGVMIGLALNRGTLNIMSMIGIIMLMGLVTKNAILLVDFANQARGKGKSRADALVDAGQLRLRPIVMTTLAMIFGMIPTALALGAGSEFRAPMAHAVIGGLITSTLLTLIVVPVVYTYLDDFGAWAGAYVKRWTSEPTPAEEAERARPAPEPAPEPEPESQPGAMPEPAAVRRASSPPPARRLPAES